MSDENERSVPLADSIATQLSELEEAVVWLRSMPSPETLASAAILLFLHRRGGVSEETAVPHDEFGEFEIYVDDTISRIRCLLDGAFKADEQ
jgi:hypothetical protein